MSRAVPLTPGEITACVRVAAAIDHHADLPDPIAYADLEHAPDIVAATVRRRAAARNGPDAVSVFAWPKSRFGRRPMACMDPFDVVAYRALVGRHAPALAAQVDQSVVLSARLAARPPGWRTEHFHVPIQERRKRGLEFLDAHGMLATLDITEYYPNISRGALETLATSCGHGANFQMLLDWLDALHATSKVTGLPIGPGGSELLANPLLRPADAVLDDAGVTYLRYMDDTWAFVRAEDQFHAFWHDYVAAVGAIGLTCHPTKCQVLKYDEARETIWASVLDYAAGSLDAPGSDDHDVARDLLDHALVDPDARSAVLRHALGRFRGRSTELFPYLTADPTLLSLAPGAWRKVIRDILSNKKATKATEAPDWVIEQVTQPLTGDDAHRVAILLQAAAPVFRPTRVDGAALLDVAQGAEGHAEPVQVGAAHLWGRSQAFKPATAVEAAEAAPTLAAKRGWAITLTGCERAKRAPFAAGVRSAHADLEATAEWLLAA
jgi:hypothetical protein